MTKKNKATLGAVFALAFLMPFQAGAEQLEPVAADAALRAATDATALSAGPIVYDSQPIIAALQRGKISGIAINDPEPIYQFYKARGFAPLWTAGNKASTRATDALVAMEKSWQQGLNPANYQVDILRSMIDGGDLSDTAEFEILMSNAAASFGRDLTGMRVSAKAIGEDTRSWRRGMKTEDVLTRLSEKPDPAQIFSALSPQKPLYTVLSDELVALIEDMKAKPQSVQPAIPFPGLLRPRSSHPAIAMIRKRFALDTQSGQAPEFYDDAMVEAIQAFQKKNGLKPDGVIGQRTIDAVNQGRRDRLVKLIANLERMRWTDAAMPEKYILVNVPAMTLWAVEDGKLAFEMPVIVGKPDWPTNSFRTDITGIRFNPSWYVPPSIQTKDLLPQLQKNPNALAKKNIQLLYYTSDGARPVQANEINWAAMTEANLKNFAMIQNPGDENPLGKIRVLMPNQYNIYLHDTNSPDLFTKDFRALSHGCIRLAEPKRVANFILDDRDDWNEERLKNILSKRNTIEVASESKIPVYIVYQTIWEDGQGELTYGRDIYGNDEKLIAELAKKNRLPVKIPAEK